MLNGTQPDLNLNELRILLHKAVEDCLDYCVDSKDPQSKGFHRFTYAHSPLPLKPENLDLTYLLLRNSLLKNHQYLNQHPGFFGWSIGSGSPINLVSSLLTAAINAPVQSSSQLLGQIEIEVINWIKEIMGWPSGATGLFLSGSSVGNLMGLTLARHANNRLVRTKGNSVLNRRSVIGRSATHISVKRALNIMGIGEEFFINIKSSAHDDFNYADLEEQLEQMNPTDLPFCLVASLGTTNRGAFDDLPKLRKICDRFDIWLHIDAAWGAWLSLDHKRKHLVKGLELGDSLTIDFHKWPGLPIGTGLLLVQNTQLLNECFSLQSDYLDSIANSETIFSNQGLELTRPSRALAVWLFFKFYGLNTIGQWVSSSCDLAGFFSEQLKQNSEIFQPYSFITNTVVFRINRMADSDLLNDQSTQNLIQLLWNEGLFMPSILTIDGKKHLRLSFLNPHCNEDVIRRLLNRINLFIENNR